MGCQLIKRRRQLGPIGLVTLNGLIYLPTYHKSYHIISYHLCCHFRRRFFVSLAFSVLRPIFFQRPKWYQFFQNFTAKFVGINFWGALSLSKLPTTAGPVKNVYSFCETFPNAVCRICLVLLSRNLN
jgi:hypothetical protein